MSQERTQVQIVNLGLQYRTGLDVSYATAATVTVAAGQCRDSTNTFDIVVPSLGQTAPLTCSTAFDGLNGLDTGTVEASTTYGLFVVFDPTGRNQPGLLLSKSFTAPIMPSANGYTYGAFRLIDFVLTDGSSNIRKFYNTPGVGTTYKQYDAPIQITTAVPETYTPLDLSVAVPTIGYGRVIMRSSFTPAAANDTASITPTGSANDYFVMNGLVATVAQTNIFPIVPVQTSGVPKISYKVSNDTAPTAISLWVLGYEFTV